MAFIDALGAPAVEAAEDEDIAPAEALALALVSGAVLAAGDEEAPVSALIAVLGVLGAALTLGAAVATAGALLGTGGVPVLAAGGLWVGVWSGELDAAAFALAAPMGVSSEALGLHAHNVPAASKK